jgi:hypothetical protein
MTTPPPLPPNLVDTIDDSAALANDLIGRSANTLGDFVKRWLDGLSYTDVDMVTKNIGTDINKFWLAAYATAEKNVKPGNP